MSTDLEWSNTVDAVKAAAKGAAPDERAELYDAARRVKVAGEKRDALGAEVATLMRAQCASEEEAFTRAQRLLSYAVSLAPACPFLPSIAWEPGPPVAHGAAEIEGLGRVVLNIPGAYGNGWTLVARADITNPGTVATIAPPWRSLSYHERIAILGHRPLGALGTATIVPNPRNDGASAITAGGRGGASEALLWRWRHDRAIVFSLSRGTFLMGPWHHHASKPSDDVMRRAAKLLPRIDAAMHTLAAFRGLDASPSVAPAAPPAAAIAGLRSAIAAAETELSAATEHALDLVHLAEFR